MYPGTQVLALINIGERTISDYLLDNICKIHYGSFRKIDAI